MESITKKQRNWTPLLILSNVLLLITAVTLGVLWQKDREQFQADRMAQEKISTLLGTPALTSFPPRCAAEDNSDLLLVPVNPYTPVDDYYFYAGACKWKDSTEPPILFTFRANGVGGKNLILNNGTDEPWCLQKSLEGNLAAISKASGIPVCGE